MNSILLIGIGRFGRHIAMKLFKLNHQVMAVDRKEELVQEILPYVTNAQIGDSTNKDFLSSLGVRNYDACIVAIGNDFQSSLETTSLLKELGAKKVISQATTDVQEKFLLRNGADEVVYPEKQLAQWTAVRCSSSYILDYVEINREHAIFEVPIPKAWLGKTIGQLNVRKEFNVNIVAVKADNHLDSFITADTLLSEEKTLMVMGSYKDIQKCFHV